MSVGWQQLVRSQALKHASIYTREYSGFTRFVFQDFDLDFAKKYTNVSGSNERRFRNLPCHSKWLIKFKEVLRKFVYVES